MMDLIDDCRNHDIDQIVDLPDVRERTALYLEHDAVQAADPALRQGARQPGGTRLARGKDDLCRQPFLRYRRQGCAARAAVGPLRFWSTTSGWLSFSQ
jgi:hypothetical protein